MSSHSPTFHDEQSLADAAEDLGNQALQQGLIHSFVVRHFADTRQFYIPDEHQEPLTPEQAYLQLKALVKPSNQP
ncbi:MULTISPECIES: hypothetical protein [unclassified Nodosilinea]|uniref:Uncharacterized protein n=1 Tax=Leptolyngbya subtilissima DQ-A4 TaxID=2933933 RepID=A0ABV0JZP0_9CYAN|nr:MULTISPECIES: hypothetical protein [unclassified Nodosilinea]MBD2110085.1 hypothetical protein [Nodosilinea sp. FACHB-13]MBD2112614.1 hypothetical protein [Nodosilinea sp. FACHB-141]